MATQLALESAQSPAAADGASEPQAEAGPSMDYRPLYSETQPTPSSETPKAQTDAAAGALDTHPVVISTTPAEGLSPATTPMEKGASGAEQPPAASSAAEPTSEEVSALALDTGDISVALATEALAKDINVAQPPATDELASKEARA